MTVGTRLPLLLSVVFLAVSALLPRTAAASGLGWHDRSGIPGSMAEESEACDECHNVSGRTATRGWVRAPVDNTPGWYAQKITRTCYVCHAPGGPGHDVTQTAMNSGNHYNRVRRAPPAPNAVDNAKYDNAAMLTTGLPYVTTGALACTSCHNVHQDSPRPYLNRDLTGANGICDACHPGRRLSTAGVGNLTGSPAYSTHPVEITATSGASSAKATILSPIDNSLKVPLRADNSWRLGGHLFSNGLPAANEGDVDCQTCHAVHGSAASGIGDLLAIDNRGASSAEQASFLCEGCHSSVRVGGQVGESGTDHPMDGFKGRPAFYPPRVGIPVEWRTGGDVVTGAALLYDNAGMRSPRCSSCHDAHGGKPARSILRKNVVTAGDGFPSGGEWCWSCHSPARIVPNLHHSNTTTDNATFTSSVTCSACHGAPGAAQEQWRAHNGFADFVIAPDRRGDDTGAIDNALNFYNTGANTGTFQNLCEYCHIVADPATFVAARGFSSVQLPSRHGNTGGTASHLTSQYVTSGTLSVIKDIDRTYNSYLRGGTNPANDNTRWGQVSANAGIYANANIVSKFGRAVVPHNPDVNSHIICESCHNLVYNAGQPADPLVLSAGGNANLLLYNYVDDGSGTATANAAAGDGLCRGCHSAAPIDAADLNTPGQATFTVSSAYVHYPAAHTVPGSIYAYDLTPYGRSRRYLITTPNSPPAGCPNVSTADAAEAPGRFSYVAASDGTEPVTVMNCDSCHRPHNAANNSAFTDNAGKARSWILEPGPDGVWLTTGAKAKTETCGACHNVNVQCQ